MRLSCGLPAGIIHSVNLRRLHVFLGNRGLLAFSGLSIVSPRTCNGNITCPLRHSFDTKVGVGFWLAVEAVGRVLVANYVTLTISSYSCLSRRPCRC